MENVFYFLKVVIKPSNLRDSAAVFISSFVSS